MSSILLHPLPPATCDLDYSLSVSGGDPSSVVKDVVGILESNNTSNVIGKEKRDSNASSSVDLECGVKDKSYGGDCRICHLSIGGGNEDSYELGCCCKDDLGTAHKQCAEVWFRIKGNKTCEICGSTAQNVAAECIIIGRGLDNNSSSSSSSSMGIAEDESQAPRLWKGRRFLNFLMVFMVLAFVVSWLFHFHLPKP